MNSFYCQLDYEHIPYPSPVGAVNGNLANNGCGVCSASMLVENMLDVPYPPEVAAKEAKAAKAGGTTEAGRVGNRPYARGRSFGNHYDD